MTRPERPDLRSDVPHGARIWNYWLGGKDNFAADREVGDAVRAAYPSMPEYALRSREFLVRAVRYLVAEAGIRQFLDVGTGLPTMQNTHEVAQSVAPESTIVYVDNDPLVLTHARALLTSTPEGRTTYVDSPYQDSEAVLRGAAEVLDLSRPVAVLFMGVFGYVDTSAEAMAVIDPLVAAVPSGSYLALWGGTDTREDTRAAARAQAEMGSPYVLRSPAEVEQWFHGLDIVEPGLVPVTQWRPEPGTSTEAIDAFGGIGRKS